MAVEWLRSCYASTWRLSVDLTVLTRGYYFFSDPTAKHYQGLHNLGSSNWTTDDRRGEPITLGEVTTPAVSPRSWRSGGMPVGLPDDRFLGSGDCFIDGEVFPPPVVERTLILGVDSRCWEKPPLAPAPNQWAWHRPEEIAGIRHGGKVTKWLDISGNSRHLTNTDVVGPIKDNFGERGRVFFTSPSHILRWQILGNGPPKYPGFVQYAVYFHGHSFSTAGPKAYGPRFLNPNPTRGGVSLGPGVLNISDSINSFTVLATSPVDSEMVFAFRRKISTWEATFTGSAVMTGAIPNPAGVFVPQAIGAGIKTGQPPLNRTCYIDEVIVYDRLMSDDDHEACLAYMVARYP